MASAAMGKPADVLFGGEKWQTARVLAFVIVALSVLLVLFHVYTAAFSQINPWVQRHFAVTVILVLGFLLHPLGRKSWNSKLNLWFLVDLSLVAVSVAPFVIVLKDLDRFSTSISSLSPAESVLAGMFIIAILELARRVVGWALSAVTVFLILQNAFAPYLPPPFYGPSVPWGHQIGMIYAEMHGIFSELIGVVTSFLIVFFFFADLLIVSGAGDPMMKLALSMVGRFAGGPAKVSVVGSAFFGTISGSPIANVMAVGSLTIPMMKKMGFKPTMAGAVEAAASTGGQFMPPVMGVVAFMIPTFVGISYFKVCLAAIIPSLLYYMAVFLQVHFEAKKYNLGGLPAAQIPRFWPALRPTWVVIAPMLAIFYFLWQGYGMGRVALYAIGITLICVLISNGKLRLTPRSILTACQETAHMAVVTGAACAAAGIITATFYTAGLGDKLSLLVLDLAAGSIWPAVLLTALVCVILGMGVPTPAIYITMVLITIPALVRLGVQPLAAHMFAFFMGVSSGLTPPVCMTAYVAGSLAGAPMMRTGITAFRLAAVGFIVPFLFIAAPEVLLIGSASQIVYRFAFASLGVVALAVAFEGYLTESLGWIARLLFVAAAITCWWPYSVLVNVIGAILMLTLVLVYGRLYRKIVDHLPGATKVRQE